MGENARKEIEINFLLNLLKNSRAETESEVKENLMLRERVATLEKENVQLRERAEAEASKARAERFQLLKDKMTAEEATAKNEALEEALKDERAKTEVANMEITRWEWKVKELISELWRKDEKMENIKSSSKNYWMQQWMKREESFRKTLEEHAEIIQNLMEELKHVKQQHEEKTLTSEKQLKQVEGRLAASITNYKILRSDTKEKFQSFQQKDQELRKKLEEAEKSRNEKEEELQEILRRKTKEIQKLVDLVIEKHEEASRTEKEKKKIRQEKERAQKKALKIERKEQKEADKREKKQRKELEKREKRERENNEGNGIFRSIFASFSF